MTTSSSPPACLSCGGPVEPEARFCPSCGRRLFEPCPSCGTEARLGSRFCSSCGHRLDSPAPTGEERKLVTVLFADLTGSTALGERLDPERLRSLLADYFAAMASEIESWGGVVEKFIGDAVMAVFGIPAAGEDDAERSVRAALGMQERLAELNDEFAERHGVRLAVRIGVNSGEVVAGLARDQFMVTGDVVNVAARLQQTAEAGEVVVAERTLLATRGAFRAEPVEDRTLRGKSDAVRAWRVLGPDELVPPSELVLARTTLVGRSRELALLEGLFADCIEEARPRLATILGDAGVGKSRLTEEFVTGARDRGEAPAVFRGRCLPYGKGITYWALREVIWTAAGILIDDGAEVAAEKLGRFVGALLEEAVDAEERDRVLFAVATTAGIALPENPLEDISPESIGEELGLAWPRLLSALAARRPTIVVIDDLHRAEPPLLDMVEHLLARSTGPLLLVAPARPELAQLRPGWSAKPRVTQIGLEPLSDNQAEKLLLELVPTLGDDLRRKVLDAAEGNPLFVEEIVEHLVDERVLARTDGSIVEVTPDAEVRIPDTVRAVLAARVDALEPDEKQALQAAAVVGRVFWSTTIESMLDGPVGPTLRALEDKGFVLARPASSLAGRAELAFRHGLIREVAYDSLPKARRASTHAEVARWLEEIAGDRRHEYVELIAHHYEAAAQPEDSELAWPDDPERRDRIRRAAVAALTEAGRAEAAKFSIDLALGFGDRALALARTDDERLEAFELKADAAHAAVRADEAWEHYLEAVAAAERLGDLGEARRLRARATLHWARWRGMMTGDEWVPKAREFVEEGLDEAGDGPASFELGAFLAGRAVMGFWLLDARTSEEARRDAERAIEIAQEVGSETLLSYALDGLYMEVMRNGFCESGSYARRAAGVGQRMEDRGEAHELLVTSSLAFADAGRFDEAAAVGAETVELAARLGPHRTLHSGSALTRALLPPGRLVELREATATAPALVAEEGLRTCFHGLRALAGQALCAFECGDDEAAGRALEVFDAAEITSPEHFFPREALDILRPVVGVADARRRLAAFAREPEDRPSTHHLVARLRLEVQLVALECDWAALDELDGRARALSRTACAPSLAWIADWAHAAALADRGEAGEACTTALAAAAKLEEYGEHYVASRLLVDLLPRLEPERAADVATRAVARLDGMGATSSAAEARTYL